MTSNAFDPKSSRSALGGQGSSSVPGGGTGTVTPSHSAREVPQVAHSTFCTESTRHDAGELLHENVADSEAPALWSGPWAGLMLGSN